ncbi:MAG: RICIN domain-containing protein [Clostridia bacterium]|nr:RICIN domain-containing protein [Clostridia bacterium]
MQRKQPAAKVLLLLLLGTLLVLGGVVSAFADEPAVKIVLSDQAATAENAASLIADGYYRIRNVATGKYLDTYDLIYDYQGSAYLDGASGQNGQDFYVSRREDGTYTIVPQSDGAAYSLSYAAGTYVTKRKAQSETECFDIFAAPGEGQYTIAPAFAKDSSLVVQSSTLKTYHGFVRAGLGKYTADKTQLWIFEPVPVTKLTLAYTEVRERLYSVGTYYAALQPYPTSANAMTWVSDNEDVLMIDNNGAWCALSVGVANVTVSCGGMTATCRVEVVDSPSYAYYSQHNIDGTYWNGSSLSGIYFSADVTKRYAIDQYNRVADWMDEGCALTAHAICLRNLGATLTKGYDFRSGQTDNLPADPYTVSLANSGNNGAKTAKATLYGNPILVNHQRIASRFNLNGKALTCTQTYYPSNKQIKEALDKHPEGVVVGLYHPYYESHYLLFTKCVNPEETNPNNYKFIVCDPAAYDTKQGDNIPFEQSYSYRSLGYRYYHRSCMLVWDVVDEEGAS